MRGPKPLKTATTHLCATKPDLSSFEGRLGFHQAYLEDRLEAVKSENPKLIAFLQKPRRRTKGGIRQMSRKTWPAMKGR